MMDVPCFAPILDVRGSLMRSPRRLTLGLTLIAALAVPGVVPATDTFTDIMKFAADMAKRGNWREALYRWEVAERTDPGNPKVLNNLGVAHETLGNPEKAREYYDLAIAKMGEKSVAVTNRRRAAHFWDQVDERGDGDVPTYDRLGLIPGGEEGLRPKSKQKGKAFKVPVTLPVPARLDLEGRKRVLVASFLTDESYLLDINRELVRFVRSELRKETDLEIVPIVPPPAVPEQTLSDLVANDGFWQYLGREYDVDLIVSGIMLYDRRDASGFRDVDVISPATGQKVRQSQFVEQERFLYELDVIFMDGKNGELLFRDRLQRSSVFRGTQNDPITAFYELSDSIAPDLLAIVKPRTREDVRFVFKK
jgi:hypothetical protein